MPEERRSRWLAEAGGRARTYDDRWAEMAARGEPVHGEAEFVTALLSPGGAVLDAGCGTGRVAAELARRGFDVVGVDLDASMLEKARTKAPGVTWMEGDLVDVAVGRRFDVVLMAGNVMIYVGPGTEAAVVANMARHVAAGGALVAGFQLDPGRLDLATYDAHAAGAGLTLEDRFATWDRDPYTGGAYAVSVHRGRRTEDE